MGLFAKRQSDQSWLAAIKPSYDTAYSLMADLNQAMDNASVEDQIIAIRNVVVYLPAIADVVKSIAGPSSSEARHAAKLLNSALKNYVDGAKAGANFFRDMASGPGARALTETGMVRRAAVSRLVFSESIFKELIKSGRNDLERVCSYLSRAG